MGRLKSIFGTAILLLSSGHVNAALFSRFGGQAVYDDVLDITWLADANLAASNSFGVAGVQPDGSMFGNFVPDLWLGGLNNFGGTGYLGFNNWRFTTSNCQSPGYNCTDSEFGHLFYNELGGSAFTPINSSGDPDLALFNNIVEENWYWTGSTSSTSAHLLVSNFGDGANSRTFGSLARYNVWAVHDGDIGVIPVPATFWLFSTALIGLLGFNRTGRKSEHFRMGEGTQ